MDCSAVKPNIHLKPSVKRDMLLHERALAEPFGPNRQTISPGSTAMLAFHSTCTSPSATPTARVSSSGIVIPEIGARQPPVVRHHILRRTVGNLV